MQDTRQMSPSRSSRRIPMVIATLTIVTLLAVIPGGALAGKGKPAPAPAGGGSVVVNPNPVAMGANYTISGSGWAPSSVHAVKIVTPTATQYLFAFVDANGSFLLYNNTWSRGTFPVEVWQSGVRRPALEARTSITLY